MLVIIIILLISVLIYAIYDLNRFYYKKQIEFKSNSYIKSNQYTSFFKEIDRKYKKGEITFPYQCELGEVHLVPTASWKYFLIPKDTSIEDNNFIGVICNE